MNLRKLLANLANPFPAEFDDETPTAIDLKLKEQIDEVLAPRPPAPPKPRRAGRVIKQTTHAEFDPNPNIEGGRVIKVMPRQLQKMKAAQEKVESDDGPKVEDLED